MDKAWKFLSCTIRAYFPYTWNRGRDKEVSNFATSIYQTLNWVAIGTKPGARSLCKTGLSKFVKLNALIDIIGLAWRRENVEIIVSIISTVLENDVGRYSYSLRAGRSGDRIPVGTRFSASVQTGPEAHPANYTMGNGSLSRG
jgi:hypothetical protein